MKTQTTNKQIRNNYKTIIKVGYCNLQRLLMREQVRYYTAGVNGWNSDIYIIENVAISTGYNPIGSIKPSYEVLCKYEEKAKQITNKYMDYEKQKKMLYKLIIKFIDEVTNENNI